MKETTGIDLGDIVKAGSYDAKVNRNINITGVPEITIKPEEKTVVQKTDEVIDTEPTI